MYMYCKYVLCGVLSAVEIQGAMQGVLTCPYIELLQMLIFQKYCKPTFIRDDFIS